MKKKDILEYMNEIVEVPKKHVGVIGDIKKDSPEADIKIVDEKKDTHEGKSCKEAHPNMSHTAWKKNMEESDTLDLNLLEKEIYEDIKNEEYGKMSKKDIMEMIGFSKINEECVGYHFHGGDGEELDDGVEVSIKKIDEDKEDKFELDYCPKCMAMKNHLDGVCQNCKKEKIKENEDTLTKSEMEEIEDIIGGDVETKPTTKPTTKPAKTPRRNSPFNPPQKKPAPAKALSEEGLSESIIAITKNLLNV
tara:strand:+ start:156 stop:902 length:747 start_codon:yes stop_codon:yes gene_type:complete